MRNFCIAAVAAGLILAPAAWADPLSPGRPAGVQKAQENDGTMMIVIGVGVAAAAIGVAASSGGGGPTAVTTSPTTTSSTTTS